MGRVKLAFFQVNDPRDSEIPPCRSMVPLHQLRRCGPLKTFQNVRNESGFGPRFSGHLGNRTRCLTLGISQALHCHDTPSAPRTWWVLCRDNSLVSLNGSLMVCLKSPRGSKDCFRGHGRWWVPCRPSKLFCVILCWKTCVKTLYPWWISK